MDSGCDQEPEDWGGALRGPLTALFDALGRYAKRSGLAEEQHGLLAMLTRDVEELGERLERLVGAEAAAVERPSPKAPEEDSALPTLLVVDDDPYEREALAELLGRSFRVLAAGDGSEAVRLVHSHHPSCVVTDLRMPSVDGYALLSTLRGDARTANLPLVVLSGMAETSAKIRAFEAGACDYVTKPVAVPELVARVKYAISRAEDLERERRLQSTDALTGLANRRLLGGYLASALRASRRLQTGMTVVALDQDELKALNDRYGHAAGDSAIQAVARALQERKRGGDCAARIGGDEFVVVMPATDRGGAQAFVSRVEEHLRKHPVEVRPGVWVQPQASFGMASFGEQGWEETQEQLLDRADRALYEAKATRKDQPQLTLLA